MLFFHPPAGIHAGGQLTPGMNILEKMAKEEFGPKHDLVIEQLTEVQKRTLLALISKIGVRGAIQNMVHCSAMASATFSNMYYDTQAQVTLTSNDSSPSEKLESEFFDRIAEMKIMISIMELIFDRKRIKDLVSKKIELNKSIL